MYVLAFGAKMRKFNFRIEKIVRLKMCQKKIVFLEQGIQIFV